MQRLCKYFFTEKIKQNTKTKISPILFTTVIFEEHCRMKKDLYFCALECCIMKNVVEISRTQVIMTFVATCIETTARALNTSYKEVYQRMKRVDLIERFILPHYETLHSESRENLAGVLVECLNNWEGNR